MKLFRLRERVAAGRGIDDKQDFLRRIRGRVSTSCVLFWQARPSDSIWCVIGPRYRKEGTRCHACRPPG
jgi:hypothetical protein